MRILAYNLGHDGAVSYLDDGKLIFSLEAEKDSNWRYSPVSTHEVFKALRELPGVPDVVCTGGWWPRDGEKLGSVSHAGYRGVSNHEVAVGQARLLGKDVRLFSSSHERSHILCAFGLSSLPKGTPCYALVWEGAIGTFYEIDSELNIAPIADVMNQPGNRYILLYGLADPSFPKNAPFSRFSDAGKLMALASFSTRSVPTESESALMDYLINSPHLKSNPYKDLASAPYYNVGVDDREFRNFAGIYSDKIFDVFYQYAKANLKKGLPLVIAGGCGLNCDWNSKWKQSGLFEEVFVPPVANDSGSAIGTAVDAQYYFSGNPKVEWSVYSGLEFDEDVADLSSYEVRAGSSELVADMLAAGLILGWVSGRFEIGPRALGNRSILAAPFSEDTRVRLNVIKQREQFRPIAPLCLEEDAYSLFGCEGASPYMLYTYQVKSDKLPAVTHVNRTARIQTVSRKANERLYELLRAFKSRTGYGVLCNTSLNFSGRGFINRLSDLALYSTKHQLDGFVVEGRCFLRRSSNAFQTYRARSLS